MRKRWLGRGENNVKKKKSSIYSKVQQQQQQHQQQHQSELQQHREKDITQTNTVTQLWPALILGQASAAEEGLQARGNNNAEQAVRDHRRSAEDSSVHHHYWSPSVVIGERKEEEERATKCQIDHCELLMPTESAIKELCLGIIFLCITSKWRYGLLK